jgi:hypothetical protein
MTTADEVQIEQQVKALEPIIRDARALVIRDQHGRDNAMAFLRDIKAAQKKVDALCEPIVSTALAAHRAAVAQRKMLMDPFVQAESAVKARVIAWDQDQERRAEEERQRLQAIEDAKAEAERKRALAAAAKLKTDDLREERIAEAQMIAAPVVQVAAPVPRSEGEQVRVIWKAELPDKAALIAAAAAGNGAAAAFCAAARLALCLLAATGSAAKYTKRPPHVSR